MRRMLTAIMLSAAAAAQAQVSVSDDYGNRVTLQQPARRVVSLAPHLTELLYAAGAGERMVAAIEHSDYPEQASKLPRIGSEAGIMEKSGAWYSFNGDRIGQGRDSAKEFLKQHPEIAKDIREKILDKAGIKRAAVEAVPPEKKDKSKGK